MSDRTQAHLTRKTALSSSHPELLERIEYLAGLEPNWDGYGSSVVSSTAVDTCTSLLNAIDEHVYAKAGEPFVAPMADGGLELEWECVSEKELMLVIPPEGTPVRFLLATCAETEITGEISGVLSEDFTVDQLFDRILS